MLRATEVSSAVLPRLAATMLEQYGRGLPAALQSSQRPSQTFRQRSLVCSARWRYIHPALIPVVNGLASAMNSPAFQSFASVMGAIASGPIRFLSDGFAALAQGVGTLGQAIGYVADLLSPLTSALSSVATTIAPYLGMFGDFGAILYTAAAAAVALGIAFAVIVGVLSLAAGGLAAAATAVGFFVGIVSPAAIGIVLAFGAAVGVLVGT
jgi:hypothetical protein